MADQSYPALPLGALTQRHQAPPKPLACSQCGQQGRPHLMYRINHASRPRIACPACRAAWLEREFAAADPP